MFEEIHNSISFTALTVFDTLVIVATILLKAWPTVIESTNHILVFPFAHPALSCSYTMSIYLTVLMTLERFYAVCLKGMEKTQANKKRITLILLVIFVFTVMFNSPKFLEYTLKVSDIRTDYDLEDKNWEKAVEDVGIHAEPYKLKPYMIRETGHFNPSIGHLKFLQEYRDIAESGTNNYCEF